MNRREAIKRLSELPGAKIIKVTITPRLRRQMQETHKFCQKIERAHKNTAKSKLHFP